LLFNAQILAASKPNDTVNFLDPLLWTWAEQNLVRGVILKDMLRKADKFNLEFYFEEEADWTKIVSFPYSGSKFDARTSFDDMIRELLTNLYKNYGRKITRSSRMRRGAGLPDDLYMVWMEETGQMDEFS
jgi:large subunit ribosomal protein L14e